MNIKINDKNGIILKTKDKFCDDDINITINEDILGGGGVIEVNEFPTENVQDEVIYKKSYMTTGEIYVSSYVAGVTTFKALLETMGAPVGTITYYEVEELPNDMQISDLDVLENMYVYIVNGICYVNAYMEGETFIITLGELCGMMLQIEGENKGYIDNPSDIPLTENPTVYVVKGKEITELGGKDINYTYTNNEWVNQAVLFENLITGSIEKIKLGNISQVRANAFFGCTVLKSIDILKVGTILDNFEYCTNLATLILRQENEPPIKINKIDNNTLIAKGNGYIYVADTLLNDYKSATNWAEYADQIRPLSEYVEE